jgi:hypothetical protein
MRANYLFARIIFFMKLDHYEVRASETFFKFTFESKGPKGIIEKIVLFTLRNSHGMSYFNLGFGDLNTATGEIDDLIISDNNDTKKIFATIAAIVIEFLDQFPYAKVYAEGSTKSRTRLYQIVIAANLDQIGSAYEIFGYFQGKWQSLKKNIAYEAFLISRKKV